jgi:hypothetical protein
VVREPRRMAGKARLVLVTGVAEETVVVIAPR